MSSKIAMTPNGPWFNASCQSNCDRAIRDPALEDAILDLPVHKVYRMGIKRESLRKAKGLSQPGIIDASMNR
jgi:hypothetical protein